MMKEDFVMNKMIVRQNEKGLTLVELLATLVILAIIATIAILSIGHVIHNSKEKAIIADAVQVIEAAKLVAASGEARVTDRFELTKIEFDDIKKELSGTSKKLEENLGKNPTVIRNITTEGNIEYRLEVTNNPKPEILKIDRKSKYYPTDPEQPYGRLTEERLKKALNGQAQQK